LRLRRLAHVAWVSVFGIVTGLCYYDYSNRRDGVDSSGVLLKRSVAARYNVVDLICVR